MSFNQDSHLVSVIIPCYNQAHFLKEAIESVLGQTNQHFEIVVMDDGSTDNTSEVAAGYPHVRCIRHENQGLPASRNAGIRASQGSYLVFLDSDDRLLPEALEIGVECLRAHPECAFVFGVCNVIAGDGSLLRTQKPWVESDHYLALLRHNDIWCPATVMYRRGIFDSAGGFNTSLKSSEDYDFYFRIVRNFKVHCHNRVIAEYRRHGMNMSGNHARMLHATLAVYRTQRDYVKGNRQYEEAYKKGIRHWQDFWGESLVTAVRSYAGHTFYNGKRLIRSLLVLLQYYPRGFNVVGAHYLRRAISKFRTK